MLTSATRSAERLSPALRSFIAGLRERRIRTAVDRELARRTCAAVEGSSLGGRGLSVYVHDGSVDVYGTVLNDAERERVMALLAEQPGAKRITDHLQTKATG